MALEYLNPRERAILKELFGAPLYQKIESLDQRGLLIGPVGPTGPEGPAGVGAGASATTVEKDLGSTPISQGRFVITDVAISATSKVLVWQAPGPYTGKGTRADEAEMQPVQITCVEPGSGSATVSWQTPPLLTLERQLDDAPRRDAAGATFDRLDNQRWPDTFVTRRLGKVRGYVKFSYAVFS